MWRRSFSANTILIPLLVLLPVLTAIAYWPGLTGPLVLDDLPQLEPLIEQRDLDPSLLYRNYLLSTSGPLGRPVSMASFILDATTHGADIWWWKYDSLMYHLICGLLLTWLVALLTGLAAPPTINRWVVGLVAGGLWLLHPLQVSTVLYTVQRMTILSTLFVFAGLVSYTYGRTRQILDRESGWPAILASFGVFLPAAALSKESGVLLAAYITLVEFVICRFRGDSATERPLRLLHYALIASYLAGLLLLVLNFDRVVDAYAARDFSMTERVLTQFRVLVTYLFQILVPLPQLMGFFHDDIEVSTGLLTPPVTLVSMLVVLGLIAAAVGGVRRFPLVSFGVLFFFTSHALESTIFGLELMFEHRNYTGSPGILLGSLRAGGLRRTNPTGDGRDRHHRAGGFFRPHVAERDDMVDTGKNVPAHVRHASAVVAPEHPVHQRPRFRRGLRGCAQCASQGRWQPGPGTP
jgi:hypothetical protein